MTCKIVYSTPQSVSANQIDGRPIPGYNGRDGRVEFSRFQRRFEFVWQDRLACRDSLHP